MFLRFSCQAVITQFVEQGLVERKQAHRGEHELLHIEGNAINGSTQATPSG